MKGGRACDEFCSRWGCTWAMERWACFWVVAQLGLFVRSVRVFFASYNGASQGRPDRRAYHRGEGPAREADRSMERETDKNDLLQRQTFLFMCLYVYYSKSRTTHNDYRKRVSWAPRSSASLLSLWQLTSLNNGGKCRAEGAHIGLVCHTRSNFTSFLRPQG